MMPLSFDELPGARERQLRRKYRNPLFGNGAPITQSTLEEARRDDRRDAEAFDAEFRALIEQARGLPPNVASDRILALKERLEQAYERAAGVSGERSREKQALERLIGVIVHAVEKAAGNDPKARQELAQEGQARRLHFALLKHALIADLLNPQSPIASAEIVPTLLSETEESLRCALELFDAGQLVSLYRDGRLLLARLAERGVLLPDATDRLLAIERALHSRSARELH